MTALLLAAAVLAPAITLAILGAGAYRAEAVLLRQRIEQDQGAITGLVAGRLVRAAAKALDDLQARLVPAAAPDLELELRFTSAHPLAHHIFILRRGQLRYPVVADGRAGGGAPSLAGRRLASEGDVRQYVSRLREERRLAALVRAGVLAENMGQPGPARALLVKASRGRTAPAASALLGLSRLARRQGEVGNAAKHYQELRRRFQGKLDPDGTAYALLADAGEAETLGLAPAHLTLHRRLLKQVYGSSAVSRRFYLRWNLRRLAKLPDVPAAELSRLRGTTARLFSAEAFGAALSHLDLPAPGALAHGGQHSITLSGDTVLVMRREGDDLFGFAVDEDHLRGEVAALQRAETAPALGIKLELWRAGRPPPRPSSQVLSSRVLDPPLSHWTLAAYLPSSDPIEALARRSEQRRLGLVAGLVLVLVTALVLTFRGVRRESELARLKTDFASNVSHELKTPLTSIRMYAEMLQEGIATTEQTRRRYQAVLADGVAGQGGRRAAPLRALAGPGPGAGGAAPGGPDPHRLPPARGAQGHTTAGPVRPRLHGAQGVRPLPRRGVEPGAAAGGGVGLPAGSQHAHRG